MARWQPPPPPRAMHQMWQITDASIVAAKYPAQFWALWADKISEEVARNFTTKVGFSVYPDPYTRSVVIEASTRVSPRQERYEPKDTDQVFEGIMMTVADQQGLSANDVAAILDYVAERSAKRAATPQITPQVTSWATSLSTTAPTITAWGNLLGATSWTIETPPPPEPEPMWSPTAVYGFRRFRVVVGSERSWGYQPPLSLGGLYPKRGVLAGAVITWESPKVTAICFYTSLSSGAIHRGHAPEGHDAPHWGCHCGVYVTWEPGHSSVNAGTLATYTDAESPTRNVIALVKLTGTVVEHKMGARGEHGEIVRMWAGVDAIQALREAGRYSGVEMSMVDPYLETPDLVESEPEQMYSQGWVYYQDPVRRDREAGLRLCKALAETRQRYIDAEEAKWLK